MSQVQVALSVAQHGLRPPWPSTAAANSDSGSGRASASSASLCANTPAAAAASLPAYSRAFRVLVEACWHQDPKMRPSFKTLLAPPSLNFLALSGDQHATLRDPSTSWLEFACAPPPPPSPPSSNASPPAVDLNPPGGAVSVMAALPVLPAQNQPAKKEAHVSYA